MPLTGVGVLPGTVVTALGSGSGGAGTYVIGVPLSIPAAPLASSASSASNSVDAMGVLSMAGSVASVIANVGSGAATSGAATNVISLVGTAVSSIVNASIASANSSLADRDASALTAAVTLQALTGTLLAGSLAAGAAAPSGYTAGSLTTAAAAVGNVMQLVGGGLTGAGSGASAASLSAAAASAAGASAPLSPALAIAALNTLANIAGTAGASFNTSSSRSAAVTDASSSLGASSAATLSYSVLSALDALAAAALRSSPPGSAPVTLSSSAAPGSFLDPAALAALPPGSPIPNVCTSILSIAIARLPLGGTPARDWNMSVPGLNPCTPPARSSRPMQLPPSEIAKQPNPTLLMDPALIAGLTAPGGALAGVGASVDIKMVQWGVSPMSEKSGMDRVGYNPPLSPDAIAAKDADAAAEAAAAENAAGGSTLRRLLGVRALGIISSLSSLLGGGSSSGSAFGAAQSLLNAAAPPPTVVVDRLPDRTIDARPVTVSFSAGGRSIAMPRTPSGTFFTVTIPLRDLTIVNWDERRGRSPGVSVGNEEFSSPRLNITCPRNVAEAVSGIRVTTIGSVGPALSSLRPQVWLMNATSMDFSAPVFVMDAPLVDGDAPGAAPAGAPPPPPDAASLARASQSAYSYVLQTDCGPDLGRRTLLCGPGKEGTPVTFQCPLVVPSPTCMWYDTKNLKWATDGCFFVSQNATAITCRCNHLTDFSVRFASLEQQPLNVFASSTTVVTVNRSPLPIALVVLYSCLLASTFFCWCVAAKRDARLGRGALFARALRGDAELRALAKYWAARGQPWTVDGCVPSADEPPDSWKASVSAKVSPAPLPLPPPPLPPGDAPPAGLFSGLLLSLLGQATVQEALQLGKAPKVAFAQMAAAASPAKAPPSAGNSLSRLLCRTAVARARLSWPLFALLAPRYAPHVATRASHWLFLLVSIFSHFWAAAFLYANWYSFKGVVGLPMLSGSGLISLALGALVFAIPARALADLLRSYAAQDVMGVEFPDIRAESERRLAVEKALAGVRSAALLHAVGVKQLAHGDAAAAAKAAANAAEAAYQLGWRNPPKALEQLARLLDRDIPNRAIWAARESAARALATGASVAPLTSVAYLTDLALASAYAGAAAAPASDVGDEKRKPRGAPHRARFAYALILSWMGFNIGYTLFFSMRYGVPATSSLIIAWVIAEVLHAAVFHAAGEALALFWYAYAAPGLAWLPGMSAHFRPVAGAAATGDVLLAPLCTANSRIAHLLPLVAAAAASRAPLEEALLAAAHPQVIAALAALAVTGGAAAADAGLGGPLAVGQSRASAILAIADKRLRQEPLEGEPPPPPPARLPPVAPGDKVGAAPGSTDSIGSPLQDGGDGGSVREPGSPGRASPGREPSSRSDGEGGGRRRERSRDARRHERSEDRDKRRERTQDRDKRRERSGRSSRRERSGGEGSGRDRTRSRTRSESPARGAPPAPPRASSPPSGRISPPGRVLAPAGGYGGAYPAPHAPMPAPMAPRFFPAQGLNLGPRPSGGGSMAAYPRAAPGLGPARGYGALMQPFPAPRHLAAMGAVLGGAPTSPTSPTMRGAGAAVLMGPVGGGWYAPASSARPRALPPLGPARPAGLAFPGSPGGFPPPPPGPSYS
jgi:hypothetical protein